MSTKLLSEADVSARLSLPDALDTVEKTYIETPGDGLSTPRS